MMASGTDWGSWADAGWCPAAGAAADGAGFDELCAEQGCAACTASAWHNPYDPVFQEIERWEDARRGPVGGDIGF